MSPLPPPHSDEEESARETKKAVEMPVHVQLETEPPQRKPGRPRLDISANFQDTGEMANHSHRLVWCIACIKSGRPMYKRDRMPARGDLMLRHLQACKYVEEGVKQRFRKSTPPPRSASVSSSGESKARKAGVASVISEPGPMSSAIHHHYQNNTIATSSRGGYHHGQHQRPETAPVTLPSIATAVSLSPIGGVGQLSLTMPPPLPLPLRPPYSMGSSHSPSNPENQLPRIRSPQIRSTTSMELPSITRRPHPYLSRTEPFNGHHHASPAPPALRGIQGSPSTHLDLRVSPESASRTPSSVHTSPPLPAAAVVAGTSVNPLRRRLRMGSAALGIVLQIASADSARLAARLGYDWACVDVSEEHFARGPAGTSVMAAMVAAICASSAACAAVVRLPHGPHWPTYLWAAIEAGAHAIIAPGIGDYEHMCAVVVECRRASAAAAAQGSIDGLARDVMVIPQIDYMEAIDDILSADGVDAAIIASSSPTTADRALRAAYHRAVPAGVDCRDAGAARRVIAQGFRIASVATDVDLLQAAAVDQLRLVQAP